ncbi:MAG: hypothetical protein EA365_08870 [Gloeocapsa sp. DLM2.Bin57]|nr:MAG: hypothetical protein EA365_08870 [Gloeocapsa sp. DLM2.Bin57]
MTNLKWAPLIYGKTYEKDFRFLVIPEDFSPEILQKVGEYIKVTMKATERLPNHPRWLLLRGSRNIIGVTCMARELLKQSESTEDVDYSQDIQGRPIYVFVGYVIKDLDLPSIFSRELNHYTPLYEYIIKKWNQKTYDQGEPEKIPYSEELITLESIIIKTDTDNSDIDSSQLNYRDSASVYLWSPNHDESLWREACLSQLHHSSPILSFCTNLATVNDFFKTPFLNGTAFNVSDSQREIISKGSPEPPIITQRDKRRTNKRESTGEHINYAPNQEEVNRENIDENWANWVDGDTESQPPTGSDSNFNTNIHYREDFNRSNSSGSIIQDAGHTLLESYVSSERINQFRDTYQRGKNKFKELLDLLSEHQNLGQTQRELINKKVNMVQILLKKSKQNMELLRDLKNAESFLNDAFNLMSEILQILQQRDIKFVDPNSPSKNQSTKKDPFDL